MKTIITLLLSSALAMVVSAQTQFDYMGGIMVDADVDGCLFLAIDNNLGNDVKIVRGFGNIYMESVDNNAITAPSYTIDKDLFWSDCEDSQQYNSNRVYLIKGVDNIGIGTHVLPFIWNELYHYIVADVINGSQMIVRGWVFNINPDDFECYIVDSVLGIKESALQPTGEAKLYNTLGQEVREDYRGVVIEVYDNGLRKTTIR